MSQGTNEAVEVDCKVLRETEKAYQITDGKVEVWIPKSHVSDVGQAGRGLIYSLFIPQWLAKEKGLI